MTKLDRLVRLAEICRSGRRVTVREMSRVCGVSERTVYRYLRILDDLDMNRDLKKPRSGSLRQRVEQVGLLDDDLRLAEAAFRQSPLRNVPALAAGFNRVIRLLRAVLQETGRSGAPGLITPPSPGRVVPVSVGRIVERFLRAGRRNRAVIIRFRAKHRRARIMLPVGLRIEGSKTSLAFRDPQNGRTITLRPNLIASLNMCRSQRSTTPFELVSPRPAPNKS